MFKQFFKPKVGGPFRGLFIRFESSMGLGDFQGIFAEITFKHPNYLYCEFDKHKCLVFYKHPYDVATIMDKYKDNRSFHMSIYIDKLSKTLRPDILYILSAKTIKISNVLQQLNGQVIQQTNKSIQVQFDTFKQAGIAYEEMRKDYVIKFAYKSGIYTEYHDRKNQDAQEPQLFDRNATLQRALSNYEELVPDAKREFKKAIEEIHFKEKQICLKKIKKASSGLQLTNLSWNQEIDAEKVAKDSDESDTWEAPADRAEVMSKIHKMYTKLQEKNQHKQSSII